MIQVYKMKCPTGGYDKSIPNFLPDSHTKHLRGNSEKLYVQQCNKNIRKYSFSHRATILWNSLPDHVVNSEDVIKFEKNLDELWANQPILYEDFKKDIIIDKKVIDP